MIFKVGSFHSPSYALSIVPRSVLAIHVGPRYVGFVLLEEHGLIYHGFRTITLRGRGTERTKGKYLAKRIERTIRLYKPDTVSIGKSRHPLAKACRNIHREILGFLKEQHIPYECHASREIRLFMLGRRRQKKRDHLAKILSKGFTPFLANQISLFGERERYRRTAWLALGLAVLVFAHRFPLSIIILAHRPAYRIRGFSELLRERIRALDDGEVQ